VRGQLATLSRFYTHQLFYLHFAYRGRICTEVCISRYMKRLNETTGHPFQRGFEREDGFVFFKYRVDRIDDSGHFQERWIPKDKFEQYNINTLKNKIVRRNKKKETLRGYVHERFMSIRKRAADKNLPFDLDVEYLLEIWVTKCPALGIDLDWSKANGQVRDNTPSLDKIIPELGYVKGNVQWLSQKANTMKSNATRTELENFAQWILNEKK